MEWEIFFIVTLETNLLSVESCTIFIAAFILHMTNKVITRNLILIKADL